MAIGLVIIGVIHVHSQEKYSVLTNDAVISADMIGCVLPEQTYRAFDLMINQNDVSGAADFLAPLQRLDMCRWIEKGAHVAIEGERSASKSPIPHVGALICARPRGVGQCFWIVKPDDISSQ